MDTSRIVLPGEIVADTTSGIMCGNGVTVLDDMVIATVRGFVTRISQLLAITPMTAIYTPNVGDIVVGRVVQVQQQRWRVQIGCAVLADLRLSSIYLPNDDMRRRTTADERNMRAYFDVGDLVCAEVQQVQSDGGISLHTRQQHPKRLDSGIVVEVPSRLIKRVPLHVVKLELADRTFDVIYGLNGAIWISPEEEDAVSLDAIARMRCCLVLMATHERQISSEVLCDVYRETAEVAVSRIVSLETAARLGFVHRAEEA